MSDKYAFACAEYVKASDEVNRLTRVIGKNIHKCANQEQQSTTCLDRWHEFIDSDDNKNEYGQWEVHPSEFQSADDACDFCLATYAAIHQRKTAKKALAVAKRRITIFGRQAIKSGIAAAVLS